MKQSFSELDDFLAEHMKGNVLVRRHLQMGSLLVYVRLNQRNLENQVCRSLDVCDITVDEDKRGQGVLRHFLDHLETLAVKHGFTIYIENIINPVLMTTLVRRGYECITDIGGRAWLTTEKILQKRSAALESGPSL